MRLFLPLVLAGAIAGLASSPVAAFAAPQARTETASSGAVAATLAYTLRGEFQAADERLAITRAGVPAAVADDGQVTAACRHCRDAMPLGGLPDGEASSLRITDLTGDGDPEVIVDFYSGGAHCCWISVIYGWDPASSSYRPLAKFWGDPGYSLRRLGSGPGQELLTSDFRFAYAFCAYVCSAMPVVVYRYEGFRLVDVTSEFPQQMRSQNRELRRIIRSLARREDERFAIRGMLPALCANLYRLDRGGDCHRLLGRALRRGWLQNELRNELSPGGRRYVRSVLRFLERSGYR